MGATYTRQSSYTDGDVINAADTNDEFDQLLAAFNSSSGHTHDGTTAEGGPITKLLGTAITIGDATSGTDIAVTFDGETNDGLLTWMEDEDYFKFSDDILMNSTEKLQFGDTASFIQQSSDGVLRIDGEATVDINASTAVTISNDLKLDSDAAVLGFGSDNDVTLTHVADTALLLNAAMVIQFRDSALSIGSSTDGQLDIAADAELEITSPIVDIDASTGLALDGANLNSAWTVNTTNKIQFRDTGLYINSSTDGQLDIDADTEVEITAPTVHIAASTAITMGSDAITFGEAGDTDIVLTFNANTADGVLTWMEDEDYFKFSDDILMNSTEKLQFGDTASFIQQSSDGTLRIDGEAIIDLNASTRVDVSGDIKVGGEVQTASIGYTDGDNAITIADGGGITAAAGITSTAASNTLGATSFNDANITNVGDVALDSISADDTDINIAVTDNSATALTVKQGGDAYIIIDTANSSESVSIGTGISGTAITIGHSTSETTVADNLTVSGNLTVDGNFDVTGTFDLSDSNFTNAGDIQLDSITGDSDTNTSITFSGSDVITVATGGSTSFTVDASQNILMNAAQRVQLRDTAIYLHSSADGQADLVADSVIQITAPTVNVEASTAITLESDAITLGENGDTDVVLTFNANSADGVITWMEDEDYFQFSDDILMATTEKIQFRDTASFIHSSADGTLTIEGEAIIDLNASTRVDVSGDIKVGGEVQTAKIAFTDGDDAITVADGGGITAAAGITSTAASNTLGATSFNEANITNVGDIALDSISADGTDINVAVSDNSATALTIKQGSDAYLIVDTADSSESVAIGTGVSGTVITLGHGTSETTVSDNLTVTGNLTVSGTTTTVDTTNTTIKDNLLELNSGASSNSNDVGVIIERGSTGNDALIMWDESEDKWTLGTTTASAGDTGNLNITAGTLVANLEGNVTGTLQTASQTNITSVGALGAGSISSGFGNIDNGSSTITTTGAVGTGTLTVGGDLNVNGDTTTFQSANSQDPLLMLVNNTDDAQGARLTFIKDKGGAGADGDDIGVISFISDNDAQQQTTFAKIFAEVSDATDGVEGGKLSFQVASHDGELVDGLVLTDGNAEDEIDVTIASGTSSVTTVAGTATFGGALTVSGSSGSSFTSSSTHVMSLVSTEAGAGDGPRLVLQRDSASPANNDNLGVIEFYGDDDGGNATEYARIYAYATDVSDGAEDGALGLSTKIATSTVSRIWMPSNETVFNENSADLDFRVESNGNANMIFVDGGNDKVGIGTANPATPLHVVGANGILVDTEGNGDGSIYFGGISGTDRSYVARSVNDLLMWNVSDGVIKFATNNTERLRIAADGAISTPTAGADNVRLGVNAGDSIASGGDKNTIIGDEAGDAITTGIRNNLFGYGAGGALIDADYNVAIGTFALGGDTYGSNSTAIGNDALGTQNFTSAQDSFNTAIGYDAGQNITTGVKNTIIGAMAGDAITGEDHNTLIGYEAGGGLTTGRLNTVVGSLANDNDLKGWSTVAIGVGACTTQQFNSGTDALNQTNNTAVGYYAGSLNQSGKKNTSVGSLAADDCVDGNNNTAIGYNALSEDHGDNNTAVGAGAGAGLGSGADQNTFVGSECGDSTDDGEYNSALGFQALSANCGDENTAMGRMAGVLITGSENTCLGDGAGATITSGSQNVCLGHDAGVNQISTSSNLLYIARTGAAAGNDQCWIHGTDTGTCINGDNSTAWAQTSDRRIKKNITDSSVGLTEINKLKIRNFEYRTFEELDSDVKALNDGKGLNVISKSGTKTGVIAQEVEEVFPNDVQEMGDGTKIVTPSDLNYALIKAVQELSAKVTSLEAEVTKLKGE